MKQHQQPSDEEIQSYMNFDRLLDSRKVALSFNANNVYTEVEHTRLDNHHLDRGVLFGEGQPTCHAC